MKVFSQTRAPNGDVRGVAGARARSLLGAAAWPHRAGPQKRRGLRVLAVAMPSSAASTALAASESQPAALELSPEAPSAPAVAQQSSAAAAESPFLSLGIDPMLAVRNWPPF